jgi:hypothetical protein
VTGILSTVRTCFGYFFSSDHFFDGYNLFFSDAGHGTQTDIEEDSSESDGKNENIVTEDNRLIKDNVGFHQAWH